MTTSALASSLYRCMYGVNALSDGGGASASDEEDEDDGADMAMWDQMQCVVRNRREDKVQQPSSLLGSFGATRVDARGDTKKQRRYENREVLEHQ